MNTQFHTPSFGDEDFDLSDCGLLPSATVGVVSVGGGVAVGGAGTGGIGGGTSLGGNNNYMQQHQLQTKRVRNMEHTAIDEYGSGNGGAHDEIGVYGSAPTAMSTLSSTTDMSQTQYINCGGNATVGGGMTMNMSTPTTMGARKQINIMTTNTPSAAAQNLTPSAVTNASDPNEPVKPLSAYALFFHDTVSAIKPQNPNCSFQELTRIVASMWEALDPEHKNVYNKKNELACKEYLKNLRIYRQQQHEQQQQQQHHQLQHHMQSSATETLQMQGKPAVYTITSSGRLNATDGTMTATTTAATANTLNCNYAMTVGQQQQQSQSQQYAQQLNHDEYDMQQHHQQQQQQQQQHMFGVAQEQHHAQTSVNGIDNDNNSISATTQSTLNATVTTNDPPPQQIQMLTEAGSVQKCTRENCNKRAIINPDWEDEYCSNECVVLHCRNVFNSWVKSNLEARKQ